MSVTRTADSVFTEIHVNEGATWGDTETPTFGYMVSVKGYEYRTDVYSFGPDVIEAYEAATPLREGMFYGAWVDGTDVYLDVSMHVTAEAEAFMIADIEDQKAVYDLYTDSVVFWTNLNKMR